MGSGWPIAASAYLAFQHVRLHALFACVAVVVGGSMIGEFAQAAKPGWRSKPAPHRNMPSQSLPLKTAGVTFVCIGLICLTRSAYRGSRSRTVTTCDPRNFRCSAAAFRGGIRRGPWISSSAKNSLPTFSAPIVWADIWTGASFPTTAITSTAAPYHSDRSCSFAHTICSVEPPDSPAWMEEADARGISTIIVPLARYKGMTLFPQLHSFCRSKAWSPVLSDEVSAIFVRRNPATDALTQRLQIDCDKTALAPHLPTRPLLRDERRRSHSTHGPMPEAFSIASNDIPKRSRIWIARRASTGQRQCASIACPSARADGARSRGRSRISHQPES